MEPDFSGYATRADVECSDGRTITADAFKHMDGKTVPLVWSHGHNSPQNVLGHVKLEAVGDGIRAHGFFNDTEYGQSAKKLVIHKDIKNLSIWANNLIEKMRGKAKQVLHGNIREVSLVLSGANPGALIDFIAIQHSDDPNDVTVSSDEAIIHTGLELDFEEEVSDEDAAHAAATLQEIYDTLDTDQKNLVHYLVGAATNGTAAGHSDDDEEHLEHQEGTQTMSRNIFESQNNGGGTGTATAERHVISHDAMKTLVDGVLQRKGTMKEAVQEYALAHGIDNLEVLFPDYKNITNTPQFIKRRTEWVTTVLNSVGHTPFSRVKTLIADITMDEARAKGYIKGSFKKEEWFRLTKRTTGPTTVYKKQALDRDDVVDITDFDVVAWMRAEMRVMLEEELARAILIGDGRAVDDDDKIKDPEAAVEGTGIRSIYHDHDLFAVSVYVDVSDAAAATNSITDSIVSNMSFYKGSGSPTFFTTLPMLTKMLLTRDTLGRRLYQNQSELASAMMVSSIVTVEPMEQVDDLVGIIVNLSDYNVGADRGGEVNLFDDFDIDFNLLKYLIETRISGGLVKIRSALVIKKADPSNTLVAAPASPTFNSTTGVVTIVATTGVVYKDAESGATLNTGAQTALAVGDTMQVVATPASGYYLENNGTFQWSFTRDRGARPADS
jgi:hypothetical protein